MPDAVSELYSERHYPALSHPDTHPAVLGVAAQCAGLRSPAPPNHCRLLELGCATGHNLLPLAVAYPNSQWVGIDSSEMAINQANQAAAELDLSNVEFHRVDLAHWDPEDRQFDYLIAYGVLSWVSDEVKASLLRLSSRCLSDNGLACISYNTLPGWALRSEAAAMARALTALTPDSGSLLDELTSLAGIGASPYNRHLSSIYKDMQRKGPDVLPFDDLAPICHPFHFGQVVNWADQHGLRYLGESTLPGNLPPGIPPEALPRLHPLANDPVLFQQTLDLLSGRTHRASLFGLAHAPIATETHASVTMEFHARLLDSSLPPEVLPEPSVETFYAALVAAFPSTRFIPEVIEETAIRLGPDWSAQHSAIEISGWLYQAARFGWIELRTDAISIEPVSPTQPKLSKLNQYFAKSGLPIVDALHRTVDFPRNHRLVLATLDGSRTQPEIENLALEMAPDLHVEPWLAQLASRGLFSAAS